MAMRIVVAVFDGAVQAYGQPFFVPAVGAAIRSFSDEVNRSAQDNSLYNHPDDYDLFHLAVYDDETGFFTALEGGKRLLVRGKEVKQS